MREGREKYIEDAVSISACWGDLGRKEDKGGICGCQCILSRGVVGGGGV